MEKYYYLETKIPLNIEDEIDSKSHKDFGCRGVEDFSIEEAKVDEILGERSYSGGDVPESVISEVEAALKSEGLFKKYYFNTKEEIYTFQAYITQNFHLSSKFVEATVKDWNQEWKKNYKPILVGEDLEIIPGWEKENYQSKAKKQIYIYPGMGFGTGSHETTFLCLKILLDLVKEKIQLNTCLDFGCGSGILGLAYRLFDSTGIVDLYDIDKEALTNSVQNIELNNLKKETFNLLLPKDRDQIGKKYSLVFANILRNVLLLESQFLANSITENGFLILSGLLKGQENEVISKIHSINPDIIHLNTLGQGDWVAVLMGKKMRAIYFPGDIVKDNFVLEGASAHHLINVLRLKIGSQVLGLNGLGKTYHLDVFDISKTSISFSILFETAADKKFKIDIAVGKTKKEAMDLIIKQCCELGIENIKVLETEFSQRYVMNQSRVEKLLISGIEQSNNPYLPKIEETKLEELKFSGYTNIIYFSSIGGHLADKKLIAGKTLIIIGPEGGFSRMNFLSNSLLIGRDSPFKRLTLASLLSPKTRISPCALASFK